MKVTTQKIPDSQVVLEIEVERERVEKALDRAYKRLVQRTKVPGFRPGKAPRAMLERFLGPDVLLNEALDRLVPEVYREAVEEEDLHPIDLPSLEVASMEPLRVKATVPGRPTVELGDYRSLRVPKEPALVPDARVQAALEDLQRRYAILEPVERPVQWEDIVRADVSAFTAEGQVFAQEDVGFRLRQGAIVSLPGFEEKLIGLQKGVEAHLEVEAPADYPDRRVAGKTVRYRVLVKEIKQERLPPLDDAFARQVGEGFPSLAALRDRILSDLQKQAEEEALHRYHDRILAALEAQAALEFPPVLVEREVERLLGEQKRALAQERNPERYLQEAGKSEEEARQELRPLALERVRRSLILTRVAEVENIEVTDAEVEEEVEKMASAAGPQGEEVGSLFAGPESRDALRRSLLTRKTLARLVEIASEGNGASAEPGSEAQ